jgi:hypothetical protein
MKNKTEEVRGRKFEKDNVEIDNKRFVNCTFNNCNLIYNGLGPTSFSKCTFHNSIWSLNKYASNTLGFMRAMYHKMGPEGRNMVEGTFDRIRAEDTDSNEMPTKRIETELPESIGEYKRRIAQIQDYVIIEYSLRPVFQYAREDISQEDLDNDLLLDVKDFSMYNAITKMKDKLLTYLADNYNQE